jgi:hypothetical protein
MLTSRSGRLPDRRGPSHYGDAWRTSSRPSHYGDAANDPTPTLSDPPLRINAVHQIDTSGYSRHFLAEPTGGDRLRPAAVGTALCGSVVDVAPVSARVLLAIR